MADRPIADYAVIGDTTTTALVASDGSIDWLCWPRHDSPAVFLALLDAGRGGACRLQLDGASRTSRRYRPGTNILETTFATPTGRAVLIDFMPIHPLADVPETGPDGATRGALVRHLVCLDRRVSGRWEVRPTFDYARADASPEALPDGGVLFRAGGATMVVQASGRLAAADGAASGSFALADGEVADIVLSHRPEAAMDVGEVAASLAATVAYWEAWSARCTYAGPYREAVLRSALALKLLTHGASGGIVAAATAGLPEAVPGNRNYDYRYVWLRDASFIVTAFLNLGYVREAREYLRFLREADPSRGRNLRLMYGLEGPVPDEVCLDHLFGWRGAHPVRIGNAAADQSQHDIYGELLLALCAFLDAVGLDAMLEGDDSLPEVLANLADNILRVRDEPDHGIWELRTDKAQTLHTKALLWVGLDLAARIARAAPEGRLASPETISTWERVAAEIRAEYHARGWSEAAGAYTMAYGSEDLDAAVLRAVLFGAFDPGSDRVRATLDRVGERLGAGDLVYRYRIDDGLEGDEATFTACAFWRVGCLALSGRTAEATALFDRLLARGNDLGLFAEEIHAETGEQRGNVPQGFTHMAVINHAVRLADAADPAP